MFNVLSVVQYILFIVAVGPLTSVIYLFLTAHSPMVDAVLNVSGRMLSRLGVVRWLASDLDNITSTSNSSEGMFTPPVSEEKIQADVIISVCLITLLALHVHFCHLTKAGMTALLALASLLISLLLAPALLLFACYRRLVSGILRLLVGPKFAGLMYGTDACWALEEDTSLSVINVLALADFSFIVAASPQSDEPLQTISELIEDRLLSRPSFFTKLFCHRLKSKFGYFYWMKQDSINTSDHVRWMDIEDEGDHAITEDTLKNYVSSTINKSLPNDHLTGWEILVGRYPIKPSSDLFDAMENGGWITKSCVGVRYPVLFRVHHSIGDGVALVNLFLESLGDPCTRCNTPVMNLCNSSPIFDRNFVRPRSPSMREEPCESLMISSWQESDAPNCTKSFSCDFKSIYVDIPNQQNNKLHVKKSKTCNFIEPKLYSQKEYDIENVGSKFNTLCQNVLKFMDETRTFKNKLSQKSIEDFNVVVNNRPGGEFIELINNATKLESQHQCLTKHSDNNINYLLQYFLTKIKIGLFIIAKFAFKLIKCIKSYSQQWSVVMFAPLAIINQILAQTKDVNLLHGPRLSGHKVVAWYLEQQDKPDQLLMEMIKRIRSKTGVRFSDVLLTALSASLESFYAQCNEIPQFITVVVPSKIQSHIQARASTTVIKSKNFSTKVTKIIEGNDADCQLQNTFSVAMLPLPIANSSTTKLKVFSKLRQVRKHCDVLRGSPDYLINYWLLRVVATVLPSWLLRPLLESTHSTLVMSNLPGPTRLTKLAGHTVHDLVFWVPNRTTTGVGVTVLSYAGRLQLGLMADRALIACQQDAQLILDGLAAAIQQMDQISSPP